MNMKKRNIFLMTLLVAFVTFNVNAQTKLVEEVKAEPGKAVIAYKKYVLPNGLKVIVHEDHSDPIVHVEITYHVGSARETPGRSGFAHFFEHMMFQGSENVADEEHFKIVNGSGGQMNGTTNRDRTNYFETLPSNQLETALWLEADRMGFLLNAVTKEKFETQRSTVKNEKDQRYSSSYGMVGEVKDQLLYPEGHSYSWPTIGYVDDLDSAKMDDLKNFFMKWYGPNNAILVVAGDVNTADVLKMTEKYFGPINKGPAVYKQVPRRIILPDNKYRTVTDNVFLPLTYMVIPTVPRLHRDEPALDLLSSLMAQGKNSIFYKKMVDTDHALQATINHPTSELSGEFSFQVVTYPGTSLKETRELIQQTILDFETKGFTDEDLKRVKTSMTSSLVNSLESIGGKASFLTSYEMLASGKGMNLQKEIDRYNSLTKEEIWTVYKRYIKNKKAAIVTVIRDPSLNDPNAEKKAYVSVNPYSNVDVSKVKSLYEGLSYTRPVDDFDRSKRPEVGAPKPVVVPEFYNAEMANGIKIIGTKTMESPKITLSFNIKGGHLLEDGKTFPHGTAILTAEMLNEGTQKYTSAEISAKLDLMGSNVSFRSGRTSSNVYIRCYKNKLAETLELLEQKMFMPNFDEKDFDRLKKQLLESINNQTTNAGQMASKSFSKLLYGDESPLGTSSATYNTVSKIDLNDVVKFHSDFYSPDLTNIVVVGDISKEEILANLSFLESWKKKEVTFPSVEELPEWKTTQVFLVNKMYAKQSQIRIGNKSLPYDAYGDYFKTTIMNYALGGAFNSRINLNLREDKGWTYGARTFYTANFENYPGYFAFSSGVKTESTDSAIKEVMTEIEKYRKFGLTEDELIFTKGSMVSSDALRYETSGQKAGFLNSILSRDLDKDYRQKQNEIVSNITLEEINEIAKKYLKPEQMTILVVGSSYDVKDKLEDLGYGKVQELDNEGEGKKKIYSAKDDVMSNLTEETLMTGKVNNLNSRNSFNLLVSSAVVELDITDPKLEDGDVIDIFVNGKAVLKDYKVLKAVKTIKVTLPSAKNIVTIIAKGEGADAPCTAKVVLRDGVKSYEMIVKLGKSESANLIITK
jgi:zinc protease